MTEGKKATPENSTDKGSPMRIFFFMYYAFLLALLALEAVVERHVIFPWEEWPAFYAVFGFVACVSLVLAAKYILRPLVMRREDYYE